MTLTPLQNWSPSDPDVLGPAIDTATALASDYWWVAAIVVLAWYLRWYGYAKREDMSPAPFVGVYGLFREMLVASKKTAIVVGALVLAFVSLLGFVFDVSSMIVVGLPALDPVTWATVVTGALTAGNAFEWAISANPGNLLLVFAVTFGGLYGLQRVGEMSRSRNEARETEADADDSDDEGPMDFLYAYRPDDD